MPDAKFVDHAGKISIDCNLDNLGDLNILLMATVKIKNEEDIQQVRALASHFRYLADRLESAIDKGK
jgi:hypothetical protein